jgi:hypothetical protein
VRQEAEKRLASAVRERDHAAAKVKELELRVTAAQKEAATQVEARVKAALDEQKQKELEQQRAALEKDRDVKLQNVQAEHNRQRGQLQKKIDGLNRQLQRKTADELGDGAEIDLYDTLRNEFPHDAIDCIKKGQLGADIRHQVLYKGVPCGLILIDSRNRQGWHDAYVTKLREDQMAAKADYGILATTVFKSGRKERRNCMLTRRPR